MNGMTAAATRTGLPATLIPITGRMLGIIDTYDAMSSARPYRAAISRHQALRQIYAARDSLFQAEMIEQFQVCLGVYPTGSLVELNTGEVAIVMAQNQVRRLRPRVAILSTPTKQPLTDFRPVDLMTQGGKASVDIVRSLAVGDYGIDAEQLFPAMSGTWYACRAPRPGTYRLMLNRENIFNAITQLVAAQRRHGRTFRRADPARAWPARDQPAFRLRTGRTGRGKGPCADPRGRCDRSTRCFVPATTASSCCCRHAQPQSRAAGRHPPDPGLRAAAGRRGLAMAGRDRDGHRAVPGARTQPGRCCAVAPAWRSTKRSVVARLCAIYQPHDTQVEIFYEELREAIEANRLQVFFQPIWNLQTRRIAGAESLARWSSPKHGEVSPTNFVPFSEQSDLISVLTRWSVNATLRHAASMPDRRGSRASPSTSRPRVLSRPGMVEQLIGALEIWGVHPTSVVVEITETTLVNDLELERAGAAPPARPRRSASPSTISVPATPRLPICASFPPPS